MLYNTCSSLCCEKGYFGWLCGILRNIPSFAKPGIQMMRLRTEEAQVRIWHMLCIWNKAPAMYKVNIKVFTSSYYTMGK